MQALMADSDTVWLHTPLTAETKGMDNEQALAALPDRGILMNTSRGKVLQLDAVADALRSGRL
jgi:phosphoglycerate dehydrogenase-like enzyme